MKPIIVFDTSIATENMGDKIIMNYAKICFEKLFPNSFFIHVPTHDIIGHLSRKMCKDSQIKLVCGTNLLAANMGKRGSIQWKIGPIEIFNLRDVILMGVGWKSYDGNVDLYTKILLRSVLSKKWIHSVRDSYTEKRLKEIGIKNVINTGCLTMWGLTPEFCKTINTNKAENVITTVTNYRKNEKADKLMLDILCEEYKCVYIWIQSYFDIKYLSGFYDTSKLTIVSPSLVAYDEVLSSDSIEYIGTRLHAGIRALNKGQRALIVGVDNRSVEIAKDTNMNIIMREEFNLSFRDRINSKFITDIKLPNKNIKIWQDQFK